MLSNMLIFWKSELEYAYKKNEFIIICWYSCIYLIYIYLKGRNFCGKKILQMFLPKTAKLSSRKNLKSCQCKILEYQ